jgi:hypothetical protein
MAAFTSKQLPEGFEDFDPEKVNFSEPAPAPAPITQPAPAPAPANFSAELQSRDQRIAQLESELATKAAAEFADKAVKDGKAFPAERDSLIALFRQARADDASGVACFAADGTTPSTRIAELQKSIEARPSHNLTTEELSGIDPKKPLHVLGNTAEFSNDAAVPTAEGAKISPERVAHLAKFSNITEVK